MALIRLPTAIPVPHEEIAAFCERHHIVRMWLFGSVLRDDFGPESDVDVLVEFEPGHTPGFMFARIQDELAQLLGRRVDLGTPNGLSHYIRNKVMRSAQVIYERTG